MAINIFAKPQRKGQRFKDFYNSLPQILKAEDFKISVDSIIKAYKNHKPVIFLLGAHVIKCGLSPLIIQLIKKGIINAVALSGAGMIHDFEIASNGKTSEDVLKGLMDGSFGMAKETAGFLNNSTSEAARNDEGLGFTVGKNIKEANLRYKDLSILYNCYLKKIPATVHVAIGTDIIHQHPNFRGEDAGKASLSDFHILIGALAEIGNGGVVVNIGSAVILPEVFLKALTITRNLGYKTFNFTSVNFDMLHQYRPQQNIVSRPTQPRGKGFYITGHHEIMVPLLTAAILEKLS
ncbi:MAG: deoxyhypusine synthase family protein [Candidatus Omnitrophica bacterium]|nr:deoxyhypusine synthase family protein [Candidatus Omnitrophota bacterium]